MLTVEQTAALLRTFDNILILTHVRPDGDTVGCAAALCRALRALGRTAYLLENPEITETYTPYAEGLWAPKGFVPQRVVSVDIAAPNLLPENAVPYKNDICLAIDHHGSQEFFAERTCLDAEAAACGEIVYEIVGRLTDITPEMAMALYVAVSTDCGCFVYANTTARTHRIAAALMELGIDVGPVNKALFRTKSPVRLAMEARMVADMELYDNGRVVVMSIPLALCRELGVDLIVTDHHECKDRLPQAVAVVDPHRKDDGYPHRDLSGVGVAFKLAAALAGDQETVLREYADLVCLGTVADVMPLTGENRKMVWRGLQALSNPKRVGLAALMAECGALRPPITAGTIGYTLAPRINAAGRMGHVEIATELFLTNDAARAVDLASQLCKLNRKRQDVESGIYKQAVSMLPAGKSPKAIVLADEISPDTCRLWDAKTHEKLDKDRFRRDLGGTEEAYEEVMRRLMGDK